MKILIIGGGFGGIYTAVNLSKNFKNQKDMQITLVNQTNYFLFTPLLHEVATGSLSPLSTAEPIREILRGTNIEFIQTTVTNIDKDTQQVSTTTGHLNYDYLVIATGSKTNFYHIDDTTVFELKNLRQAVNLKNHLIDKIELSTSTKNLEEKNKLTTFVIVGGGATGVELAAELAGFTCQTMIKKYYHPTSSKLGQIKIYLINSNHTLLPHLNSKIQTIATKTLIKKGIILKLGTKVEDCTNNQVTLSSGEKISTNTIIWTAGVLPHHPNTDTGHKRIEVNDFLQDLNHLNVFALGDVAGQENRAPMLAQVATKQGAVVAKNIEALINDKKLTSFKFKSQGTLLSLGTWNAVGEIGGFVISGRFTWWLWRTIYLFKFMSWRKRFRIMAEWTVNLFFPRDITKI
ncbi:MAG: NAD(P)/FAD-dependent oxidoreductase [Candidatus Paceibacterota bacterium]